MQHSPVVLRRRFLVVAAGAAALACPAARAQGDPTAELLSRPVDRRFTYVEETLHGAPPGHFEYEQWVTWATNTEEDSSFDRVDFKHELEYGLTEMVHLAVDVAEWHYEDGEDGSETRYDVTAAEAKFRFLDPRQAALGLGFKTELGIGPKQLEWENILIIDKVIDRWEFAYNFDLESEWEGEKYFEFDENGGEIKQSLGVSYEVSPVIFFGGELVYEIPLPDWKSGEDQNLFAGPNFSYRGHLWAVTTTTLFNITSGEDEPEFQWRLVAEVDF